MCSDTINVLFNVCYFLLVLRDELFLMVSLQDIQRNIESVGWHMVVIPEEANSPTIVYTIGLFESFSHPELIMMGMPYHPMLQILGAISNIIQQNKKVWEHGEQSKDFLQNDVPIVFASVKSKDYVTRFMQTGVQYYEKYGKRNEAENDLLFPVMQILWPDEDQHFPHEAECKYSIKYKQPVLADIEIQNPWPFEDAPSVRCIIGESVIRTQAPILFVARAVNGVWQFLEKEPTETPSTFSVYLEEVFNYDKTIGEIATLQRGQAVSRETADSKWKAFHTQESSTSKPL